MGVLQSCTRIHYTDTYTTLRSAAKASSVGVCEKWHISSEHVDMNHQSMHVAHCASYISSTSQEN